MSEQQRQAPNESNRRFQFSLRTLMGLTAGLSLLFGMVAWKGEQGAFLFFLGVGVCLIALGIYLRRLGLILVGTVAVVLMYLGVSFSARRTGVSSGSTWRPVPITIKVVDAANKDPIPGAAVYVRSRSDLSPDPQEVLTGTDGVAEVEGQLTRGFTSYRTMFGTRTERWISFAGAWVNASAEGYEPVRKPLTAYLGESRDSDGRPLPEVRVEMVRQPAGQPRPNELPDRED